MPQWPDLHVFPTKKKTNLVFCRFSLEIHSIQHNRSEHEVCFLDIKREFEANFGPVDERKCELNWFKADKPVLHDESLGQKPNAFTLLVSDMPTLPGSQTNHLFATIRIK